MRGTGTMSSIFIYKPCLLLIHLFLERVKGYVKAIEKSTCLLSASREVFEHSAQDIQAGVKAEGCYEGSTFRTKRLAISPLSKNGQKALRSPTFFRVCMSPLFPNATPCGLIVPPPTIRLFARPLYALLDSSLPPLSRSVRCLLLGWPFQRHRHRVESVVFRLASFWRPADATWGKSCIDRYAAE